MDADALLLALRDLVIVIEPDGNALRWHGPKDAMTTPLAAALKEHKGALLRVFRTLDRRDRDADWGIVRDWLIGGSPTFTPAMQRAAGRVFPVGANEWPMAYAHRFRSALRVRGLLRALPPRAEKLRTTLAAEGGAPPEAERVADAVDDVVVPHDRVLCEQFDDGDTLWQWWADVGGGKTAVVPEAVRRAAQRIGFTFDSFAPVMAEAVRLERFLGAMEMKAATLIVAATQAGG